MQIMYNVVRNYFASFYLTCLVLLFGHKLAVKNLARYNYKFLVVRRIVGNSAVLCKNDTLNFPLQLLREHNLCRIIPNMS